MSISQIRCRPNPRPKSGNISSNPLYFARVKSPCLSLDLVLLLIKIRFYDGAYSYHRKPVYIDPGGFRGVLHHPIYKRK